MLKVARNVLVVLCLVIATPAVAAQTAPAPSPAPRKPSVRIDVPKPSPAQIPGSAVLPAGIETASGTPPSSSSNSSANSNVSTTDGEFVIAPIPFSNEAFSFGLVPIVEYVFHVDKSDRVSPPSALILAGLVATGGSWAFGAGGNLYF